MNEHAVTDVVITGLGVQCAIGNTVDAFTQALRDGISGISYEPPAEEGLPASLGVRARIAATPAQALELLAEEGAVAEALRAPLRRQLRRAPRGKQFSLLAAAEAWTRAALPAPDAHDTTAAATDDRGTATATATATGTGTGTGTGIVLAGGSPAHQLAYEMAGKYRQSPSFVRPGYAQEFWDSGLLGAASELFGIRGEGLTTGGASAAGNVGLVEGFRMIRHGYADACLVLAPMTELSPVELMALHNLGALGAKGEQPPDWQPETAARLCRPFDAGHDGFLYGEGAAALVLESGVRAASRGATPLARIRGGSVVLHGERGTAPSVDAEVRVMRRALDQAGLSPGQIDYVNAHATSTPLGDETEAAALAQLLGEHATTPWVNATKSLTGHCLGPASAVEAVACVQQLRHGFAHSNPHLKEPITEALNFVPTHAVAAEMTYAINNSFGFSGINSCLVLERVSAFRDGPDDSGNA